MIEVIIINHYIYIGMILSYIVFKNMLYNLWDSTIVDLSGALFIWRIHYEYTRTQCEEGARDVNNI